MQKAIWYSFGLWSKKSMLQKTSTTDTGFWANCLCWWEKNNAKWGGKQVRSKALAKLFWGCGKSSWMSPWQPTGRSMSCWSSIAGWKPWWKKTKSMILLMTCLQHSYTMIASTWPIFNACCMTILHRRMVFQRCSPFLQSYMHFSTSLRSVDAFHQQWLGALLGKTTWMSAKSYVHNAVLVSNLHMPHQRW